MDKKNLNYKKVIFIIILSFIIILGFFIRTYAWFHVNNLFLDEGSLLQNIDTRNYIQLFLPLDEYQCCPPLFLVLGKILYSKFGMDNIIIRFLPYIFSVFSFGLFIFLSFKVIKNKLGIILSVLTFALSEWCILQQMYFKPYISDVFFTILVILIITLIRDKNFSKTGLLLLSLLSSLIVFFSYTAGFIIGCAIITFCVKNVYENKKNNKTLLNIKKASFYFVPFISIMIIYFIVNCLPTIKNDNLQDFWSNCFSFLPRNYNGIIELFSFFVAPVCKAYPSIMLFLLTFIILIKKDKFLCSILYSPFLLAFLFGAFNLYPFCGERVSLYLIPLFILIIFKPTEFLSTKNKFLSSLILIVIILSLNYSKIKNYTISIISGYSSNVISKFTKRYEKEKVTLAKEFIDILYHSDMQENEYIVKDYASAIVFEKYDYLKKFKYQYLKWDEYGNFRDIETIPSNSNIYFFISEKYHMDYKQLKDWINKNCIMIYKIKCYDGEFIKCKRKSFTK